MTTYTTIQITPEIRERLSVFKDYRRETYNEVLARLMSIAGPILNEKKELSAKEAGRYRIIEEYKGKFPEIKSLSLKDKVKLLREFLDDKDTSKVFREFGLD